MHTSSYLSHQRYFLLLSSVFFVVFLVLAIAPLHRDDWLLENVLVVVFAIALGFTYQYFVFSKISYTCIFLFLVLHEIGAHYTYAKVPYNSFFINMFDLDINEFMGWQRNHFDRLVHFSYGLLLAYPLRELYLRVADDKGFWGYFFPLELTIATSALFELFEWAAAVYFGGELGMAYLGTQGDVWDAHKDMALASFGATITMAIVIVINLSLQKDFTKEWLLSLRVKGSAPLGEEAIK